MAASRTSGGPWTTVGLPCISPAGRRGSSAKPPPSPCHRQSLPCGTTLQAKRSSAIACRERDDDARGDPAATARASYRAYVEKDRSAIEALLADDFHFTSPLDNRIDRKTYFERCWPNSETIAEFDFVHVVPNDNRVFVTYEGRSTFGKRFRNTEILTIRAGKIVDVEVYFGWSIPHEAAEGGFIDPE